MASSWQFLSHPLQLVASLWDGPATITAPTALPSAAALPTLATTSAAESALRVPSGVCGWVTTEATAHAARSFVCQALGQTMPAVVFFASGLLLVATVLFLTRYLARANAALQALRLLERELGDPSPPGGSGVLTWPTRACCDRVVAALRGEARRLPPLAAFGSRIQHAICEMDDEGEPDQGPMPAGAVALSRPVSELCDGERGLDGWTGKRLADELPAWLSAIGLLTTFIAILLGLQSVQVTSDLEVNGIAGLVNGLSGKFFSSIIALGCAVSVSIVNHFVGNRLHEGWSSVMRRMERNIPHLSAERMLLGLLRKQKARA